MIQSFATKILPSSAKCLVHGAETTEGDEILLNVIITNLHYLKRFHTIV
jgi:hypothetical protein